MHFPIWRKRHSRKCSRGRASPGSNGFAKLIVDVLEGRIQGTCKTEKKEEISFAYTNIFPDSRRIGGEKRRAMRNPAGLRSFLYAFLSVILVHFLRCMLQEGFAGGMGASKLCLHMFWFYSSFCINQRRQQKKFGKGRRSHPPHQQQDKKDKEAEDSGFDIDLMPLI